jgi:hypothetical protein
VRASPRRHSNPNHRRCSLRGLNDSKEGFSNPSASPCPASAAPDPLGRRRCTQPARKARQVSIGHDERRNEKGPR